MYIDYKVTLWERIKIPGNLEKDFKKKIQLGEITSLDDVLLFLEGRNESCPERLADTIELVKPENNEGEATFQMFDNNHNLIFSNDSHFEEQTVFHVNIYENE